MNAVSPKQFERIQKIIIDDLTTAKKPSESPVVIITGGQPGAGKTELERLARIELGGNIVSCNADNFRDYHPGAEEIKHRFETYYPELTAKYAQDWNNGLKVYCEANRLNYILETTFSSGLVMNKTIADLQQKGYRVEIKLIAVHPKISLLGTNVRFEEMKAKEKTGRMVIKEAHDDRYSKLVPTLITVQSASLYNKLQIYGRNATSHQKSDIDGIHLIATNPPDAVQVFQQVFDQPWPAKMMQYFEEKMQTVIRLKEARNAPAEEIAKFREEMSAEYLSPRQLQQLSDQQRQEENAAQNLGQQQAKTTRQQLRKGPRVR
ncbi:zeta toxin family protein [Mucilaginibacter sp. McL0603]|uniref:zeta toxin family protein n=1 Tax=Mucilaginibacter sp. McL0603 TaxID=3415670 RepID=UPI003CECA7C1